MCRECRSVYDKTRYAANPEPYKNRALAHYAADPAAGVARNVARREACPDERRANQLQHRYNLTLAEYDEILEAQGGGCAICGMTPEDNNRRLCVDHNHETGEVRGLLCSQCNLAIGNLCDDPETARQAMLYVRRWGK